MNSSYRRSVPSTSIFPTSVLSVDEDRSESFKLVDSGYMPFYSDYYYDDNAGFGEDDYYYHRPRRVDNYYGIRQEYLRSYTFTRDEPKTEKEKLADSVKRFKAVVWAVLFKFKYSQAKMLREKLSSRSSRFIHESSDYISASCRKIAVPSCMRLSSLEVA